LAGVAGAVGTASLGRQFFTAPGAGAQSDTGTLVVVFLRGGMDGLSVVVPADDPHLIDARPDIVVRAGALKPLARGFGLHPALGKLYPYWQKGQLTAVPAVSTPDISRSHFQAQDCLERGGASMQVTEGWLDRVLDKMAPAGAFRAVGQGTGLPRALAGDQASLSLNLIDTFRIAVSNGVRDDTVSVLQAFYKDLGHPLTVDVDNTLKAIDSAAMVAAVDYQPAVPYPEGPFGDGLLQLARLIKVGAGLRVGCIDLSGWDMHVNAGHVDQGIMKDTLTDLADGLAAFAGDLGDKLQDVTVVVVTEFGRRVEQNSAGGTDHGHGAVVLLLGGGFNGGTVHGNWQGLAPEVRDNGDVPGSNDYRNVLGDIVVGRLGLSPADIATVFPDHRFQPLGIMK
jgi:uncharacterized protein (DUF1501 family)